MTSSASILSIASSRAPLAAEPARHAHTSVGGFCGVCGSVWPCSQARTDAPAALVPVARW